MKYTLRLLLKVPARYESMFLHTTLVFPGEVSEARALEVGRIYRDLLTEYVEKEGPITLVVGGTEFFGPRNDIEVRKLRFSDEVLERALIEMDQEYGVPEVPDRVPWVRHFHVTVKQAGEYFQPGDVITAKSFDVKPLGPHDPIMTVSLL